MSQLEASAEVAETSPAPLAPPGSEPAPAAPEGSPDVTARLTRADELEAAEIARLAGVPETPDAYAFDLSENPILGIDGAVMEIDTSNPLVAAVAGVAHTHGISQAAMSDLARAFAETEIAGERELRAAHDAEVSKLGARAQERVNGVSNFVKAHCGEHAEAALQSLGSAGAVMAWEAMMQRITGQTMSTIQHGVDTKRKFGDDWFPSMAPKR